MDKVTIDGDTADGITRASLKESMKYLSSDIKKLQRVKNRKGYQTDELNDNIAVHNAMKKVYEYYGGYFE